MKLIKYGSVLVLHRCCKRYCSGIQMNSLLTAILQEFSLRTCTADYNHLVSNYHLHGKPVAETYTVYKTMLELITECD